MIRIAENLMPNSTAGILSNWAAFDAGNFSATESRILLGSPKKESLVLGFYRMYEIDTLLEMGQIYTVSFTVRNLRDNAAVVFRLGSGWSDSSTVTVPPLNTERVVLSAIAGEKNHQIQVSPPQLGYAAIISNISNLSVVEGDRPPSIWTPAHADLTPEQIATLPPYGEYKEIKSF